MKRIIALLVLVAAAGACSSSSSGSATLPDWNGWARWERAERGVTKPAAEVIAIGKRNGLDTCDPAGAKGAFGTAGTDRIEGDWFFLCGEGFARRAVEDSSATALQRRAALADVDALATKYGRH